MPDEKRQDLYMLDEIMKDLVRLRDTLDNHHATLLRMGDAYLGPVPTTAGRESKGLNTNDGAVYRLKSLVVDAINTMAECHDAASRLLNGDVYGSDGPAVTGLYVPAPDRLR